MYAPYAAAFSQLTAHVTGCLAVHTCLLHLSLLLHALSACLLGMICIPQCALLHAPLMGRSWGSLEALFLTAHATATSASKSVAVLLLWTGFDCLSLAPLQSGKTYYLRYVLPRIFAENETLGLGKDDELVILELDGERIHGRVCCRLEAHSSSIYPHVPFRRQTGRR